MEKTPKDPGARVLLAQALTAAGRVNEAVEQFQNALKLDAKNVTALQGLGLIAMQREEWSTAEGYWRRILDELKPVVSTPSQDSRLERAYYYLGLTLIELQGLRGTRCSTSKKLFVCKRDAADTHYALSVAYEELGSRHNQRKELETTLGIRSDSCPRPTTRWGSLLVAEGDEGRCS